MATAEDVKTVLLFGLQKENDRLIATYGQGDRETTLDYIDWNAAQGLFSWGKYEDKAIKHNGIAVSLAEQHGGEGQGDEYWIVFNAVSDGQEQYFRIDGWYSSYNGSEFEDDDLFEVAPVERTYISWEAK